MLVGVGGATVSIIMLTSNQYLPTCTVHACMIMNVNEI